jgi:signal transduction histidine kinase
VIERPDGIQVAVIAATVPLHDESGALQEVISVYHELTDQTHAQLVRDEVLSIASHELRTPLTVVLGYSSLLRSLPATNDNPRMQRAITKIYEQSLRMRELIEHLLDFSRISLGRTQLQWLEFDLSALVREVSAQQQAEAGPRPVQLALPDEPLAMTGDYSRLAQALQQVIRAAWQQPEQREIVIAIHTGTSAAFRTFGMPLPSQSERRYALIQIGRAKPDLSSAAHTNLSAADSDIASTKALELTISAELVRLHGGALLVEPQTSQGSAFSMLLPLQDDAAAC